LISAKKIIVAPLNWGLGHASRCIPIIDHFLSEGNEVILASDGAAGKLLQAEYPMLSYYELPGYNIMYQRKGSLAWAIAKQLPAMLSAIKREKKALDELVEKINPTLLISDNRYGCWSKNVYSVIITHQLMLKAPVRFRIAEPIIHQQIKKLIKKFDECWIPDLEDKMNNLSGDLSHLYSIPSHAKFIGPLSRFAGKNFETHKKYKIAAIISGPEPQRSLFEELLMEQLVGYGEKAIIVGGRSDYKKAKPLSENVDYVSFLTADEVGKVISGSEIIISRSGYSSIMDYHYLGNKAILVPTPGQTEQEYLANYLKNKNLFYHASQKDLQLKKDLPEALLMGAPKANPLSQKNFLKNIM